MWDENAHHVDDLRRVELPQPFDIVRTLGHTGPVSSRLAGIALVLGLALTGCATAMPSASPTSSVATSPTPSPAPVPPSTPDATPTPSPDPTTEAPPSPTEATAPLAGKVVVVDPGHQGKTTQAMLSEQVPAGNGRTKPCQASGTATNDGYPEHTHNWDVAVRLADLLRAEGATVVMTREDDTGTGPCVDARAAIVNEAHADLLVSIHADGAAAGSRGFHIIISTTMVGGADVEAASKAFALTVRQEFEDITGMPRSTYIGGGTALSPRDDIAGLNLIEHPGIMLEAGNMRNATDAALLTDPDFRQKEAEALASAVTKTLSG